MLRRAVLAVVLAQKGDDVPSADKNCRTYDIKTSGNRTTWRTECTGDNAMRGTGDMTMDYTGRLVGKCKAR